MFSIYVSRITGSQSCTTNSPSAENCTSVFFFFPHAISVFFPHLCCRLVRPVMCEHVTVLVLAFSNEKDDFLSTVLLPTDNKSSHCVHSVQKMKEACNLRNSEHSNTLSRSLWNALLIVFSPWRERLMFYLFLYLVYNSHYKESMFVMRMRIR